MVTRNTGGSGISFSHSPVAGTGDDVLHELGADNDAVLVLRSTVLNANTALTGVMIGTPVTPAVAIDSLLISNVTASGDYLLALNNGGHSQAWHWVDSSAGTQTLYAAGVARVLLNSTGGSFTGTWSDLGTVTTVDINGGTIDGITSLTVNADLDFTGPQEISTSSGDLTLNPGDDVLLPAGDNSLIIGHTGPLTMARYDLGANITPAFQVLGATIDKAALVLGMFSADAHGPQLTFQKSRNASVGGNTVAAVDDVIGIISAQAADGSGAQVDNSSAMIRFEVDAGTPGNNVVPGRILFLTTPTNSPAERMRIDSAGDITFGSTTPTLAVTGTRIAQSYHTNMTSTNALTVDSWSRSKENIHVYTRDALAVLRETEVITFSHLDDRDPSGRIKLGVRAESINEPLALVDMDYGHGLGNGPALDTMGLIALNTRAIQQLEIQLAKLAGREGR